MLCGQTYNSTCRRQELQPSRTFPQICDTVHNVKVFYLDPTLTKALFHTIGVMYKKDTGLITSDFNCLSNGNMIQKYLWSPL